MARRIIDIPSSEKIRANKSLLPKLAELDALGYAVWDDHFMGDLFRGGAAPGVYQSSANGTSSAVAAVTTGSSGRIVLDPGTDDDGRSDLSLGLYFQGQLNCAAWLRFITPTAVSTWKMEFGFTDVVSGTDAGAVNSKSGNTFNADNAVVAIIDTDDDTNLTLMGVKATTAATAIDLTTLSAATGYYLGVILEGADAKLVLLNAAGKFLTQTAWMKDAVTSTTSLTPWMFTQNRAGAVNRLLNIDRLLCYQLENAEA